MDANPIHQRMCGVEVTDAPVRGWRVIASGYVLFAGTVPYIWTVFAISAELNTLISAQVDQGVGSFDHEMHSW